MIDPITAVGAHAASKIVERLLNAAMPASATGEAQSTTSSTKNQQTTDIQQIIGKDLQKFLDQNPEIKDTLGESPYLLKQKGNSLTLSGSSGNEITVSSNTHFGQKALLLSQWDNSKFFEKGLELQAI